MGPLIFATLLAVAVAAPDGGLGSSEEVSFIGGGRVVGGYGGRVGGGYGPIACGPGELDDGTGRCVTADVTRNVYVYSAPKLPVTYSAPPYIPKPRIQYNVVFVRAPEFSIPEPIVIPPPREKTVVYVLSKSGHLQQRVINVPGGPALTPDVRYVHYNDGDDLSLSGVTLRDILSSPGQQGQLIRGGGAIGIGGGGGGGLGRGGIGGYGDSDEFHD